jgi:DNA-binding beta-propeller fold protein YncE
MRATAMIRILTALGACLAGLLFATAAEGEVVFQSSFGEPGSGSGQLSRPTGIAVNETTGDVYVADRDNHRIEQFDSSGSFVRMWGKEVNLSTSGDICPLNPGDVCQAGTPGDAAGQFKDPQGIGVDNSNGPAAGSVYVQDAGNIRIQRFTAAGQFVLMWGKAVDQQTGANLCTAESGHVCRAGLSSGGIDEKASPPKVIPTEEGLFKGWGDPTSGQTNGLPGLTVGSDGSVYVTDGGALPERRVQKFASSGTYLGKVGAPQSDARSLFLGEYPTISPGGTLYVKNAYFGQTTAFVSFEASDFAVGGLAPYRRTYGPQLDLKSAAVDPDNEYLITTAGGCEILPGLPGTHIVEFHPSTQEIDCTVPTSPSISLGSPMFITEDHELYVADPNANRIRVFETPVASSPEVANEKAVAITTKAAVINFDVSANLADTTYQVEYGTSPCSDLPNPCQSTPVSASVGAAVVPEAVRQRLEGLTPDTTYYYRVVVTNSAGTDTGPDRSFTTFPPPTFSECPNNLARQQTGAAFLLDCRAYELVSASDQGGYDVVSDLIPGQTPFGGYPYADSKALYAVHNGGIPNTGKPTNRGPDPYIAVRDEANERWNTEYVGVPADAPSNTPFSSTLGGADRDLSAFAFAGAELCSPCFSDGSAGIPLRLPNGNLVQGMVGAPGFTVATPEPSGEVRKHLSADGTHFIFGSKQQFAAGGNNDGVDASIYDRELATGTVRAVSVTPGATPIKDGEDVAALDVSDDGSRILIGDLVSTDSAGNRYWHLYMHVGGAAGSIDVTPGATSGVLYSGMTSDGTKVYFATDDALTTTSDQDTDASADIYRAEVSATEATLTRISVEPGQSPGGDGDTDSCAPAANSARPYWNSVDAAPNCDAVAVGGGGGVASGDGTIYFLSPERLDGSEGDSGAPNLYVSRPGDAPTFVATLESSANESLKPKAHLFQRSFGRFSYPEGVAVDQDTGRVYVLDTYANSGQEINEKGEPVEENGEPVFVPGAFVQRFEPNGEADVTFGVNSKLSESPAGPFFENGSGFPQPGDLPGVATQVAVDNSAGGNGELYVPDFNRRFVPKFDSSGVFIKNIFAKFFGFFPVPVSGIAVNPTNGNLAMTSAFTNTVHTTDAEGNPVAPNTIFLEGAGPPLGVAINTAGEFYVADGHDVRLYNAGGGFVSVFDPNPSFGVAVDPADDHVYVDEGNRVVEYDASGVPVGSPIGVGLLDESVSLAVDEGRLFISNPGRGNVAAYTEPLVPPDSGYDNPLVIDSVGEAETRRTADFQVTPDGDHAAFPSAIPLTGFDNDGRYEIFHYDANSPGGPECVSCSPTQSVPSTDATLASNGLSVTEDGRVFFNTPESLVLRDSNEKKDVYEWSGGQIELISSGKDQFDSSLLSVSADGTDAFFFTRDVLVANDKNGTLMKLYDARESGGFFVIPEPPPCVASDECHGAGSPTPPEPVISSASPGKGGQELTCKKGYVKKRGKCVKKRKPHRNGKHRAKRHRGGNRG